MASKGVNTVSRLWFINSKIIKDKVSAVFDIAGSLVGTFRHFV